MKKSDKTFFKSVKKSVENRNDFNKKHEVQKEKELKNQARKLNISLHMLKEWKEALKELGLYDFQEEEFGVSSPKNWDETWTEYRTRVKRESRQLLLNKYVPQRKCDICKKVKVESSRWVCITAKGRDFFREKCSRGLYTEEAQRLLGSLKICCRSCYNKHFARPKKIRRARTPRI